MLLDKLDQYVKRVLSCKHYVRYVDDFILMHESKEKLKEWLICIKNYLNIINLKLNDKKTILQSIDRGFDFVGHTIKPHARFIKKSTYKTSIYRLNLSNNQKTTNSYFGLIRQGRNSFNQRKEVAKISLRNGFSVDSKFTKVFRRKNETR